MIAAGTSKGFSVIQGMSDPAKPVGQNTLADYLAAEISEYSGELPRVVVTGHSLGGCLTTVVAPFLKVEFAKHSLAPTILPYTFAGPSAGNSDYAKFFDETFAHNYRYFNSLDIIPHWWASLPAIETIYAEVWDWPPDLVRKYFEGKGDEIKSNGLNYKQLSSGNRELVGAIEGADKWVAEAAHQHHITTYIKLLSN